MTRTQAGSDPHTAQRKLPIGIRIFRTIREDDCRQVDKTACIQRPSPPILELRA